MDQPLIRRSRTVTVTAKSNADAIEHAVKVTRQPEGFTVASTRVLPGNRNTLRTQRTVQVVWTKPL